MKRSRWIAVLLVFLFALSIVAGCTSPAPAPPAEDDDPEEPAEEPLSVAMLLPGPISDQGWNATAHAGLMRIQDELGATVSFTEQVDLSDIPEIVRNYAIQGFDIIIGHGFQFGDPFTSINEDFPDIKFIVTSSSISKEPNVGSLNNDNWQQGFLAGAFMAQMTQSGKIGTVAGMEIPSIIAHVDGFHAGAEYIDPDVEALSVFTGDFYDAVRAKETALAMFDQGVDIIIHNADAAGLGVLEAASENGIWALGSISDQKEVAPDVVVTSALSDLRDGIFALVSEINAGVPFEARPYMMGINEGVVGLTDYRDFADQIPQEVKDRMVEITELLANEEIPRS